MRGLAIKIVSFAAILLLALSARSALAGPGAEIDPSARLQLGVYREHFFSPVTFRRGQAELLIQFPLPAGYKYANGAPFELDLQTTKNSPIRVLRDSGELNEKSFPLTLPLEVGEGGSLSMTAALFFCSESSGTCYVNRVRGEIPIQVDDTSPTRGSVSVPLVVE